MQPEPPGLRPPLAELLRQVRQTGDSGLLSEAIPYVRFLGLEVQATGGEVLCRLRHSPMLIGDSSLPALHGGVLGGLLESAAQLELLLHTQVEQLPRIISMTVSYLRSGRPQDTLARATVTRQGRRVASLQVQAWQEERERPIASASALFLLSP